MTMLLLLVLSVGADFEREKVLSLVNPPIGELRAAQLPVDLVHLLLMALADSLLWVLLAVQAVRSVWSSVYSLASSFWRFVSLFSHSASSNFLPISLLRFVYVVQLEVKAKRGSFCFHLMFFIYDTPSVIVKKQKQR